MNRKIKIYLVILVIVCGAFVIDRLFLADPDAAVAETADRAGSSAKARKSPAPAGKTDPPAKKHDPSLDYLDQLPLTGPSRDVFQPSPSMTRYLMQLAGIDPDAESNPEDAAPDPNEPERFAANNELQATWISNGTAMAVINGRVYKTGDLIQEYRITRIDAYQVELQYGQKSAVLSLPAHARPK